MGDLRDFSRRATKYKQEYGRVPVLIIDNANKLAQNQQKLLDLFQDYARSTADDGIATVVFVSSEGRVPRHMTGKSTMCLTCSLMIKYVLIKCYREGLVKKWRRHRN
jgi:hypothetical protein